jgi:hypothetical protein
MEHILFLITAGIHSPAGNSNILLQYFFYLMTGVDDGMMLVFKGVHYLSLGNPDYNIYTYKFLSFYTRNYIVNKLISKLFVPYYFCLYAILL